MIKIISWIVGFGVVFTSCKDDVIPLTFDIVEELSAYDLGNNGNASDIRVDFKVKDNLNVEEYRVFVVPVGSKDIFTQDIAEKAPRESFTSVFSEGFKLEYSIQRLPADLLDINGLLIVDDSEYNVVVMALGKDDRQLSQFSRSFTLQNRGIYSGVYKVLAKQLLSVSNSMKLDSASIVLSGDIYLGALFGLGLGTTWLDKCRENGIPPYIEVGKISFGISGSEVFDFVWSAKLIDNSGCDMITYKLITGDGTLRNELTIIINSDNRTLVLELVRM